MKIHLLSGTLLFCLVGNAQAVALNPEGIGQVLLYPYYTVNAGNQTLVSVVNTQNAGKAVKVRFREGYNGRDVLDFNLYLSPYDVWTATVFDTSNVNGRPGDGSAEAALLTPDNSCTDPAIKTGTAGYTEVLPDGRSFVSFSNHAYVGTPGSDGGPTDLARTRTGHIELIEMADVTGATLAAITHVNGVPKNCAMVTETKSDADYVSPVGGLFGSASMVNVQNGTLYGANAEALSGFYSNTGNLFSEPGSPLPDLGSGDNGDVSPGNAVSYVFGEDGSLIRSSWPIANGGSFDAVSSLFAANQLNNEYEFNPTTGAVASEWVITFPTKTYYVDPTLSAAIAPFSKEFGKDPVTPASACEIAYAFLYDREERTVLRSGGYSEAPPPPPPPVICWEAQTVAFQSATSLGNVSPLFGSPLFVYFDPLKSIGQSATAGQVAIVFAGNAHQIRASNEGNVFAGLPAIGFLAKDFTNKNITPGVLGNYSGLYRHHITHLCSNAAGTCQ